MAIPLGRSLAEPNLLAWQIIYMQAIFFIVLGFMTAVVQAFHVILFTNSMATAALAPSGGAFRVHLTDMFAVSDALPAAAFWFAHALTALVVSVPLSRCVVRRRFVPDFVATCYVIYLVMAWMVTSFPGNVVWWLSFGSGSAITFFLTSHLCAKREMMEIEFGPGVGGSSNSTSVGAGGNGAVGAIGGTASVQIIAAPSSSGLGSGGPSLSRQPTTDDREDDALLSGTASKRKPV